MVVPVLGWAKRPVIQDTGFRQGPSTKRVKTIQSITMSVAQGLPLPLQAQSVRKQKDTRMYVFFGVIFVFLLTPKGGAGWEGQHNLRRATYGWWHARNKSFCTNASKSNHFWGVD